jgi:hypothetical protein
VPRNWQEAEQLTRDPNWESAWWTREESERRALMKEATARLGEQALYEALTSAVESHAQASFDCALESSGDQALARVASGAALMALHCRALALLAGRGDDHVFVQKYALFARGRWPLGMRESNFLLF